MRVFYRLGAWRRGARARLLQLGPSHQLSSNPQRSDVSMLDQVTHQGLWPSPTRVDVTVLLSDGSGVVGKYQNLECVT
jgi:hypothetical protein